MGTRPDPGRVPQAVEVEIVLAMAEKPGVKSNEQLEERDVLDSG